MESHMRKLLFNKHFYRRIGVLASTCVCIFWSFVPASAQKFGEHERSTGIEVLRKVKLELKDKYYDPKFHGLDIDLVFSKAEQLMAQAKSNNDLWGVIAQCVMLLNDSHTWFYPPLRLTETEY